MKTVQIRELSVEAFLPYGTYANDFNVVLHEPEDRIQIVGL